MSTFESVSANGKSKSDQAAALVQIAGDGIRIDTVLQEESLSVTDVSGRSLSPSHQRCVNEEDLGLTSGKGQ